jgi:triosephosphate isomerase
MRKNIVAGNWKMNKTLQEGLELAKGLDAALKGKSLNCDVIIGTPFIHLASVAAAIDTKVIAVAAENLQAAESRIRDSDMASEMVEYTKNQILTQSGTAMLVQANSQSQNVLRLLS